MDKRRSYYLVVDTETANRYPDWKQSFITGKNMLVYDLGFIVIDRNGTIYEQGSYVVAEIFYNDKFMKTAYYGYKKPMYLSDIRNGYRKVKSWHEILSILEGVAEKYHVKGLYAYNGRFDVDAISSTHDFINNTNLKGADRPFPLTVKKYDIMKLAKLITSQKTYSKFCDKHNFKTENGNNKRTAEVVYRYISNNPEFLESHTGLEDCLIEGQILTHALRQHKKMPSHEIV